LNVHASKDLWIKTIEVFSNSGSRVINNSRYL
jgi:hypothetical protein